MKENFKRCNFIVKTMHNRYINAFKLYKITEQRKLMLLDIVKNQVRELLKITFKHNGQVIEQQDEGFLTTV